MELREGYKLTEVGVIPEDWVVTHLGDIGQFKNGINKGSESFGHGKPFVNLLDVFGENSLFDSGLYGLVDSSDTERNTYDLKKGDVIFIRSSVKPSGVGLTAVVTEDLPQTVYSGFLIRYRDNGKIETNYKKYCFYEEGFRKKVISASSVSANTNINQDNLKRLTLAFPPTKTEQTAIALSDADAWIQSLTRLIAKKRQIKQGAMQTLLTPYENGHLKTGWVVKKLGDVVDRFIGGGTPSRSTKKYWGNDIPWVTVKDFATFNPSAAQESITFDGLKNSATHLIPKGTIITSTRMAPGKAVVYDVDVCINQDLKAVFLTKEIVIQFMLYWFEYSEEKIADLGSGSTVMGLSLDELKK